MLYNMSEVITLVKQNMGIKDLPKPYSDNDIRERIINSALKTYSIFYPRVETFMINENERICPSAYGSAPYTPGLNESCQRYRIPKHYYQDRTVLSVLRLDVWRPSGFNDYYVPQGMVGDPTSIMVAMSSLKVSAAMAQTMSRAPTYKFQAPDILEIYNGWSSATYQIDLAMTHDPSLSTIPPTAMPQFIELCQYDVEEYFYTALKRVQNLDLGIGSIELKIDEWASSADKKKDLIKEWHDTSSLGIDQISYF